MKKFLVILMVVAVSSFLFVGCLPGTTTPTTTTTTTTTTTVAATVAPIIVGVTDGAYVNKAEAVDGVTVNGTAPTYSEIKIYINDICAGTGDTLANGTWTVVVAKTDLGADGAKVLYATAKEPGLAVSAHSNEKKFTLDTVLPTIASSKAKAGIQGTAATLRLYSVAETADTMGLFVSTLVKVAGTVVTTTTAVAAPWLDIETITTPFTAVPAAALQLPAGVVNWKIEVLSLEPDATPIVDAIVTLKVTNLIAGTSQNYIYNNLVGVIASTSWIPGAVITTAGAFTSATDIGAYVLITTTNKLAGAAVNGTPGYIDVTFSESVTAASITTTGVWNAWVATLPVPVPTLTARSATVARLAEAVPIGNALPLFLTGRAYSVSCSLISDLAGNLISAAAPSTDIGVVLP